MPRRVSDRPANNAVAAITALVVAEPELSVREIASRLGLRSQSYVHRVLRRAGYRRRWVRVNDDTPRG